MKPVLVILFGSPRPAGNTHQALELFLSGMPLEAYEVLRFNLRTLRIHPCTGCDHCGDTGKCVFKDDFDEILEAVDRADGVLLATPLYFNSVSAISKIMIDRFQVKWAKKFKLKEAPSSKVKKGLLLVTAGAVQKKNEKDGAGLVAELFFKSIRATFEDFIFIEGTDQQSVLDQPQWREALPMAGGRFSAAVMRSSDELRNN